MNADDRFVELWNDYLEGELDESALAELRALVSADDRLLSMAADSYQIHRLLGLVGQESELRREDFVKETMDRLPVDGDQFADQVMWHVGTRLHHKAAKVRMLPAKWSIAIAAAAVLMMIVSVFFLRQKAEQDVVRITELNGSVRWTGGGGRVLAALHVGDSLAGGTVEPLSADSWAVLEFCDGSTVTVSGQALLTISEHEQKELHLRTGSLLANVTPQPAGKPMLIHTPTARLEVLGTQLNVEAELSSTMLNVNTGRVRVTRLADGSVADVPAEHQVVASVDHRADLHVTRRPGPVTAWQSNSQDRLHGEWIQADGGLLAAPMLWGDPEKPVTLYLVALSVSRNLPTPVQLTSGVKFRVLGRIASSGEVYFGLTTIHVKGGFAGKFVVQRSFTDVEEAGRALDIELALEDFRPQDESLITKYPEAFPASPDGLDVYDWWCCTINEDAGLSITSVELIPAQP